MSILQFKKKKATINIGLVENLRKIRTQLKQLKLQEKEIIGCMNENVSDNFLLDENNLPIAKLNISNSTGFDVKLFKEQQPEIYSNYPKITERRTWTIL